VRRFGLPALCAVVIALAVPATELSAAAPKRCVVPKVVGMHLVAARIYVEAGGCRVGRVVRVGSVVVPRRRVLSQRPAAGRRLPARARVDLVVSSGSPKH
jgi:beta-lactam-binding protein with PASTA domain